MEEPERHDGGPAATPVRRRRRAVGPAGAPAPVAGDAPVWPEERPAPEDDDERLLREVPPHHGR